MDNQLGDAPEFPEKIAAQHAHIASMVSALRRAQDAGASWTTLARCIDRLLHDVRRHFAVEEAAMDRAHYARLAEHRDEHDIFTRRLEIVRIECDRKETELMPLLTEMLDNWFKQHEKTWDRQASEAIGSVCGSDGVLR